jgi:hypothetical protein
MTKKITSESLQGTIEKKRAMAEKTRIAMQAMQAKYDSYMTAVAQSELQLKSRFSLDGDDRPSESPEVQQEQQQPQVQPEHPVDGGQQSCPPTPTQTPLQVHPAPEVQAPPPKRARTYRPRAPKVFTNEPLPSPSQGHDPCSANVGDMEPTGRTDVQPVVSGRTYQEQKRQELEDAIVDNPNPYSSVFKF